MCHFVIGSVFNAHYTIRTLGKIKCEKHYNSPGTLLPKFCDYILSALCHRYHKLIKSFRAWPLLTMLSEERGLLITPRFWQLPRGNAAFCSGGRTPQLTYWMLNIDSYYECCQTQRAVLADPEWRVVRNSISECQVRNQRPAGLFRDKIYRFYKMRKGSSTSEDGNGRGRMRLSLPWCGPLERCLTRVTTEGNAKQGEAQDKDSGSFGPG